MLKHRLLQQGKFITSALTLAMFLWGPWPLVEGRLFPVTSSIHINTPVVGADYMDFTFSYDKLRACNLIGVEATIDGSFISFFSVQAAAPIDRAPRPLGPNTSPLWRLWSPTLQGFQLAFIHHCPFEPWAIKTFVYP